MEGLSAELGMAPRTLRRHLAAEGTSFRKLVDGVRQALAEEMLAHRMTVDEIAERLGYSEASSFVHAFKRWKGTSVVRTSVRGEGGRLIAEVTTRHVPASGTRRSV